MQKFRFDLEQQIPLVPVRVFGPRTSKLVWFIFDTGSGPVQINTPIIETLGYSASDAHGLVESHGPAGPMQAGYALTLANLNTLGKNFNEIVVGVYDFDNFADMPIDGLLGFDVIKQLHLEMNGPAGELLVY